MKILVLYQPKEKFDNFEGMRLRKNIKGALELRNIPYAKNTLDSFNLIHFWSLDDEVKVFDAKEFGVPVVFSALFCETDRTTRLFEIKNNELMIDPRAERILNRVDLILVGDQTAKEILINNGITTRIEVAPIGVKPSRFQLKYGQDDNLFNKFFQIDNDAKYVVSIGTYEDKDKFDSLIKIASLCPKYIFFYFGFCKNNKVRYKNKKIPPNLRFYPLIDDELYCSMMKNASVYLAFDNRRHSPITLVDVAASKTQIVALEPVNSNKELLSSLKAYIKPTEEEVAETINSLLDGKIEDHSSEAYKEANKHSISVLGKTLEKTYKELLKEN